MNYSEHHQQTYSRDILVEGLPHGWIQWKGTNVCIDLHCRCGCFSHCDADFLYYWECPRCHKLYALGQNILLIPLDEVNTEFVARDRPRMIQTSPEGLD